MCGTAAAASSRSTVTRTSSEPACASAATWATVEVDIRRVGVGHRLHDDRRAAAKRHGALPAPIVTAQVRRRAAGSAGMGAGRAGSEVGISSIASLLINLLGACAFRPWWAGSRKRSRQANRQAGADPLEDAAR